MRLRIGPPPIDHAFAPLPPWRPLREPRRLSAVVLLSLPLGIAAAGLILAIGLPLAPGNTVTWAVQVDLMSRSALQSMALFLAFILGLVLVHELLHALAFPGSLRSPDVVLGFWPRGLVFYAHYGGEMGRDRFLWTLACPFVVIGLASLVLAALDQSRHSFWLFAGALNALSSSVDLLGLILVLSQVPRGARVRNHGHLTFWRLSPIAAPPPET